MIRKLKLGFGFLYAVVNEYGPMYLLGALLGVTLGSLVSVTILWLGSPAPRAPYAEVVAFVMYVPSAAVVMTATLAVFGYIGVVRDWGDFERMVKEHTRGTVFETDIHE